MITRKKKLSDTFLFKVKNKLLHLEKEVIGNYDVHLSSFVANWGVYINNSSKQHCMFWGDSTAGNIIK